MKGTLRKQYSIIAAIISIIGTLVAIITLYLQWQSLQHEIGGRLNASYQSRLLNNRESKTIVVCLEDTTIDLSNLNVTPTFDNPSQYSINEFSLMYITENDNVNCNPSSFYQKHTANKQENIYKYSERVLDAHGESPKPFIGFEIKSDVGRCVIKAKATYDGAPSAFEYSTDIWFIVEPNKNNLSYENWKLNCKKRIFGLIRDNYYDVYYFKKGMPSEYQFDVALPNQNAIAQHSDQTNNTDYADTLSNTISRQVNDKGVDEATNTLTINHYNIERNKNRKNCITVYTNEIATRDETIYAIYEYNHGLYRCIAWNNVRLLKGKNKFDFWSRDDVDNIEELYLCRRIPTNLSTSIIIENDSTALVRNQTNSIVLCELPYSINTSYEFVIFDKGDKRISTKGSDISKLRVYISDREHNWPFSISKVYAYLRGLYLPILFHIIGIFCAYLFILVLLKVNIIKFIKYNLNKSRYYRIIIVFLGMGYICWLLYFLVKIIIE